MVNVVQINNPLRLWISGQNILGQNQVVDQLEHRNEFGEIHIGDIVATAVLLLLVYTSLSLYTAYQWSRSVS